MRGLRGKVAVVTGGAGAFGRVIVERLLDEGMKVAITDLRAEGIPALAGTIALAHDVCSAESWAEVMRRTEEAFGPVDAVVNNAGVAMLPGQPQNPEDLTIEHLRAVYTVNVEGVLLGCQAAMKAMKTRGGSIVNISSLSALQPSPKMAAYGSSKAAMRHLTTTVAAYCAQAGYPIRCNSIHPGWIITDMTRESRTPEELVVIEKAVPMQRFGEIADVASAVAYLCSDESAYVTGSKMVMDGGVSWQ